MLVKRCYYFITLFKLKSVQNYIYSLGCRAYEGDLAYVSPGPEKGCNIFFYKIPFIEVMPGCRIRFELKPRVAYKAPYMPWN